MNSSDIIVWEDGIWCFVEEQAVYGDRINMKHTYLVEGSEEWVAFLEDAH